LDNPDAKVVSGSDGAYNPFFSPNGQWVGFFSQGKLKKASVTGGAVETVCDAGNGLGGSWAPDDTIYFAASSTSGIWKVPASGGMPQQVTKLDRDKGEVQLEVLRLDTEKRHVVVRGTRIGRYSSSGHLVYFHQGPDALMAVPFDLERLEVGSGPPITLAERVRDTSEGGEFALSDSGTLAYVPSTPKWYESGLVWVDRNGRIEQLPAPPGAYQEPVISPDGRQVTASIAGPAFGIWVYDFARTTLTSLTSGGSSQAPVWTPDGKRIVYRGTRTGFRNLFQRAADGSGEEERLTKGDGVQTPSSFVADGMRVVFSDTDPTTGYDIWSASLDADHKTQPILKTPFAEWNPHVSTDGRWLAYTSEESGRSEVYVRPFPKLDGKWKVSTDGGTEPVWSRDGRELFYRNGDKMMQVAITSGAGFVASPPRVLFEGRYVFSGTSISAYDVSPDGRRFLMIQPADAVQTETEIHIVLNWSEQLRTKSR
jgi:serine/threonine-protein kinase